MASKAEYVWMDGAVVPWKEATVHVSSEGFLRGASVFEGIRAYWNSEAEQLYIFKNDAHLRRLRESSKILRLSIKYSDAELTKGFLELIRRNGFRENIHFRPVVYFDCGAPYSWKLEDIETRIVVLAYPRPHAKQLFTGVKSCTSTWRRNSDLASPSRLKASANYHNSRLATVEARLNGFDIPVMLNDRGEVAESPGSSLMMVRGGAVVTPPVSADVLESITRGTLIQLFRDELKVPVIERCIDRSEIYVADEAFFCGSGAEIQPIISFDHYVIGSGTVGAITKRVQDLYFEITKGNVPKYLDWLTPVYESISRRRAAQ